MVSTSVYFALPPLYPSLVSRAEVALQLFNPEEPHSPASVARSYHAVDVLPWAQRFLADLDRAGTRSFIDEFSGVPEIHRTLPSRLATAREELAGHIASDLAALAAENPTDIDASLSKAKALLARQLRASLAQGYATSIMVGQKPSDLSWVVSASSLPALSARGSVVASTVLFDAVAAEVSAALIVQAADEQVMPATLNVVSGALGALQDAFDANELPVPLRSWPMSPVIVDQEAIVPAMETIPVLADMALWDYALTYSHAPAWQDEVVVEVSFNPLSASEVPASKLAAVATGGDLFDALAQYNETAEVLWAALDAPDKTSVKAREQQQAAVLMFADMAERIARCWSIRQTPVLTEGDNTPTESVLAYASQVTYWFGREDRLCLDTVTLTRKADRVGDRRPEWPAVAVRGTDGQWVALVPEDAEGDSTCYHVAEGVELEASGGFTFKLTWAGLNIADCRSATACLSASRNRNLFGLAGPKVAGRFILQGAPASESAGAPATPLIAWNGEVPIKGASLGVALKEAVAALFNGSAGRILLFELVYRYPLTVPDSPEAASPMASLPVLLMGYESSDSEIFSSIEEAAKRWFDTTSPSTTGAEWVVSLSLFAGDPEPRRLLMTVNHLIMPVVAGL